MSEDRTNREDTKASKQSSKSGKEFLVVGIGAEARTQELEAVNESLRKEMTERARAEDSRIFYVLTKVQIPIFPTTEEGYTPND